MVNSPETIGMHVYKTLRGAAIFFIGYELVAMGSQVTADITSGAIQLGEFSVAKGLIVTTIGSLIEAGRRMMNYKSEQ